MRGKLAAQGLSCRSVRPTQTRSLLSKSAADFLLRRGRFHSGLATRAKPSSPQAATVEVVDHTPARRGTTTNTPVGTETTTFHPCTRGNDGNARKSGGRHCFSPLHAGERPGTQHCSQLREIFTPARRGTTTSFHHCVPARTFHPCTQGNDRWSSRINSAVHLFTPARRGTTICPAATHRRIAFHPCTQGNDSF